jgi:hypothetical protein
MRNPLPNGIRFTIINQVNKEQHELTCHSAAQEITNVLRKAQFHCEVYKSPALPLTLIQINSVRTLLYPVPLTL